MHNESDPALLPLPLRNKTSCPFLQNLLNLMQGLFHLEGSKHLSLPLVYSVHNCKKHMSFRILCLYKLFRILSRFFPGMQTQTSHLQQDSAHHFLLQTRTLHTLRSDHQGRLRNMSFFFPSMF